METLHRLLSGEIDDAAPEARELLATDEGRRELARLRVIRDRVARAAEEEANLDRRVAELLEAGAGDPARTERIQTFREFARAAAPRPARAVLSLRNGMLAVAAALLIVAAIALQPAVERTTTPSGAVLLGTGAGKLVSPLGEIGPAQGIPTFVWELELPRDGTYLLRIVDADDPSRPPLDVPPLSEPHWSPDEQTSALPRRFHWQVVALDEFDVVRARTATGVAWFAKR